MDSLLLADVYVELLGERQAALSLAVDRGGSDGVRKSSRKTAALQRSKPLKSRLTEEEIRAHAAFVETLGTDALWLRYLDHETTTD